MYLRKDPCFFILVCTITPVPGRGGFKSKGVYSRLSTLDCCHPQHENWGNLYFTETKLFCFFYYVTSKVEIHRQSRSGFDGPYHRRRTLKSVSVREWSLSVRPPRKTQRVTNTKSHQSLDVERIR